MKITREQAKKAWDNIDTKELFLMQYSTFEDYWQDCEKFNSLPAEEQEEQKRTAIEKLAKKLNKKK